MHHSMARHGFRSSSGRLRALPQGLCNRLTCLLVMGPGRLIATCDLLQDVATALESTLDLPSILPHGARVDPTADGFLIWLPTCEGPPSSPEFRPKGLLRGGCRFFRILIPCKWGLAVLAMLDWPMIDYVKACVSHKICPP